MAPNNDVVVVVVVLGTPNGVVAVPNDGVVVVAVPNGDEAAVVAVPNDGVVVVVVEGIVCAPKVPKPTKFCALAAGCSAP